MYKLAVKVLGYNQQYARVAKVSVCSGFSQVDSVKHFHDSASYWAQQYDKITFTQKEKKNSYDVLGISTKATQAQIKTAYFK